MVRLLMVDAALSVFGCRRTSVGKSILHGSGRSVKRAKKFGAVMAGFEEWVRLSALLVASR
jgi:hypothetical protein